jgi:hypothetical protein
VSAARKLSRRIVERFSGRLGFLGLTLIYALLVAACFGTLLQPKTSCRWGAIRWPTC